MQLILFPLLVKFAFLSYFFFFFFYILNTMKKREQCKAVWRKLLTVAWFVYLLLQSLF